ncbi:MAG TPA: hypothetical protein VE986_03945 [Hyphomicrobiales bacterium]|nr:hypothetical protein [Hyphomicrobiales bacterium]
MKGFSTIWCGWNGITDQSFRSARLFKSGHSIYLPVIASAELGLESEGGPSFCKPAAPDPEFGHTELARPIA